MCCTFTESEMSDTKLYVGEAQRDGKLVHVLAYQNSAVSSGPNAMVIPFPTNTKMGQDNIIDTSEFKNFLKNITDASQQLTKGFNRRSLGSRGDSYDADSLAEVFDVGSYTVILAERVDQIPEAVKRVPVEKRPKVSTAFLRGYAALYPGQPVAICCWNGSIEAEPLLWWYEPKDAAALFIPTMDAHDGKAPVLGELVSTDHIISVGSAAKLAYGHNVVYSQRIPEAVKSLLPKTVHGHRLPSRLENADTFVKTADLHATPSWSLVGEPVTLTRGLDYKAAMNGWH